MKTHLLRIVIFALASHCCVRSANTAAQPADFGIYETILLSELPVSLSSLGISELKPGMDKNLPVVGYIEKENAAKVERIFEKEGFRLVSTYNTVDQEGKYYALVAVKLTPAVIISHVQKTKAVNRSVEIYFNRVGAGKWADLTAKNTGRMVAFIIDNRVYCMPLVNARINNGVALITGLKDDTEAKQISEHLGNGI